MPNQSRSAGSHKSQGRRGRVSAGAAGAARSAADSGSGPGRQVRPAAQRPGARPAISGGSSRTGRYSGRRPRSRLLPGNPQQAHRRAGHLGGGPQARPPRLPHPARPRGGHPAARSVNPRQPPRGTPPGHPITDDRAAGGAGEWPAIAELLSRITSERKSPASRTTSSRRGQASQMRSSTVGRWAEGRTSK